MRAGHKVLVLFEIVLSFDRVYLKSVIGAQERIANCVHGVGLSTGSSEGVNTCYVRTAVPSKYFNVHISARLPSIKRN